MRLYDFLKALDSDCEINLYYVKSKKVLGAMTSKNLDEAYQKYKDLFLKKVEKFEVINGSLSIYVDMENEAPTSLDVILETFASDITPDLVLIAKNNKADKAIQVTIDGEEIFEQLLDLSCNEEIPIDAITQAEDGMILIHTTNSDKTFALLNYIFN